MSPDSDNWLVSPHPPILRPDEIHVWRADLARPRTHLQALRQVLSAEENERAARLVIARQQRRWVVGRALLRLLLGQELGVAPREVRFVYGPHGKPELAAGQGGESLHFNLSHSGDVGLYALTRGGPVGVDVEHCRPGVDLMRIARRFFSPLEVASLLDRDPAERLSAFYTLWTCKEAYLKARGLGIATGLSRFSVSLVPGQDAPLLLFHDQPPDAGRWRLLPLCPGEGFVGAVCAEGAAWRLHRRDWLDP